MGESILKRFSVTLILVSASLNIIFNFLHLVQNFAGGLFFLQNYITIYLRFGELGIITGFVGLFVSANGHKALRNLSLIYMLLGFLKFLLIEFMVIGNYGFWSILITGLMLTTIVCLVICYREHDIGVLFVKGIALSIISIVYWLSMIVTSIIASYQNLVDSNMDLTMTVLPFFYIFYLIGLCTYFYEYYKEAFIYKNTMIRIQKVEKVIEEQ